MRHPSLAPSDSGDSPRATSRGQIRRPAKQPDARTRGTDGCRGAAWHDGPDAGDQAHWNEPFRAL
jgi:hypothetical protein